MIEIKLKTKENNIDVLLPNSWKLVKCNQFLEILNSDLSDKPKMLEILTDVDSDIWKQVKESEMKTILNEIEFLNTPFDFEPDEIKTELIIKGKKIKIPKQIEFETWGQKLFIEDKLKEIKDELTKGNDKILISLYPLIVSVYLCPKYYDKDFNEELAEDFKEIILNEYAIDIIPLGGFFFLNLINGLKLNLKRYKLIMKESRSKQALKILVSLGLLQQ